MTINELPPEIFIDVISSYFNKPKDVYKFYLPFSGDPQPSWTRAVKTVQDMGGTIIIEETYYLHASFTSRIFRFVDDFELRLDVAQNVIQMRSASRTGYSDLGVNRKRSEQFRKLFSEKQK